MLNLFYSQKNRGSHLERSGLLVEGLSFLHKITYLFGLSCPSQISKAVSKFCDWRYLPNCHVKVCNTVTPYDVGQDLVIFPFSQHIEENQAHR